MRAPVFTCQPLTSSFLSPLHACQSACSGCLRDGQPLNQSLTYRHNISLCFDSRSMHPRFMWKNAECERTEHFCKFTGCTVWGRQMLGHSIQGEMVFAHRLRILKDDSKSASLWGMNGNLEQPSGVCVNSQRIRLYFYRPWPLVGWGGWVVSSLRALKVQKRFWKYPYLMSCFLYLEIYIFRKRKINSNVHFRTSTTIWLIERKKINRQLFWWLNNCFNLIFRAKLLNTWF